MISKHELALNWREFLNKEQWDLFVTITFRKRKLVIGAVKAFKHFFKYVNTFAEPLFKKFIRCFIVFEKEDNRGGVHIHTFIKGINPSHANKLEKNLRSVFGQSKAVSYDSKKGASFYLAKKLGLSNSVHYDYFKINSRLREAKER